MTGLCTLCGMASSGNSDILDVVRSEYQQAIDTCRHLEVQRTQHLGFFFTVSFGVISIGLPMIFGRSSEQVARLTSVQQRLALAGLTGAMISLVVFVFASVHRFGKFLSSFEGKMVDFRETINRLTGANIETDSSAKSKFPYVQVRALAEEVLLAALVIMLAGSVAVIRLAIRDDQPLITGIWIALVALEIGVLGALGVAFRHTIARLRCRC